jgi:hypothetical protein
MEPKRFAWPVVLLLCACSSAACSPADDEGLVVDDADAGTPDPRPDFPVRYHTDHVDIAPGFTQPVCRGTLDRIDRHVEAVADLLDIDLQSRPTFYWFNGHADGALAGSNESCDWCASSCNCTRANGSVIYGGAKAMFHELTHAVVVPAWGSSDIIFAEGVAHGLDGNHVMWQAYERPSEFVGGRRHAGAHFTRWLVDRHGPEKFHQLFERLGRPTTNTKDEVFAVVEDVYGTPFLDLETEYFATAPDIYPAPGLCDGLVHVPWQGDRWELRATADCDSPSTFGPRDEDGAMSIAVTLDMPALPSDEQFAADILPISLGMMTPCIDAPLHDDEAEQFISGPPVSNWIVFGARPGRYRLDMPLPDTGELVVRICQWNGEWRVAGEPPSLCLPE